MRTFRNTLIGLVCLSVSAMQGCDNPPSAAAPSAAVVPSELMSEYFPLEVGNRWTYECAVEGEDTSEKTRTIVATSNVGRKEVYRSEWQLPDDPKPVVEYLSVNDSNQVVRSSDPAMSGAVPLINAAPKIGDRLGEFTVAEIKNSDLDRFSQVPSARIETFKFEDPSLTQEQRAQWRGQSYGRGIGLLEESDGLGSACVLTSYTVGGKTN